MAEWMSKYKYDKKEKMISMWAADDLSGCDYLTPQGVGVKPHKGVEPVIPTGLGKAPNE